MRKPTLRDVARTAGVSYATADRVLNARGGVAEKSVLRVRNAIDALGYERDQQAANLSRRRTYEFLFLLPRGDHSFFRVLSDCVRAESGLRQSDRIRITIKELPALEPAPLAEALTHLQPEDFDSLALVGIETPEIARQIERLAAGGMPVVTLIGDAAPTARAAYVGIDNSVAGRTAGRLIRLVHTGRRGRILPIIGAYTARDHRERLDGARAVLAEENAGLDILPPLVVLDRPEVMERAVRDTLARTPDVTGIYSMGAGNRALIRILSQLPPPRPFVVLHDLTPVTRPAIETSLIDAVIDQRPTAEVSTALDLMKALADGKPIPPDAGQITPAIYLKDNLPPLGSEKDMP